MVQESPITLRVKFRKVGKLAYVSHLDLVRTMTKIVTRAGLPLYYTEGFNPKPKMTFAAPLSIGTESLCEYMDIRLTERADTDEMLLSLNRNMTEDMQAISAYYPENKLIAIKWIDYKIRIKTNGADAPLAERVAELLNREELLCERKTKKGEVVSVDIAPLIKKAECEFKDGVIEIKATLSAAPDSFLNPERIIKLLESELKILNSENLIEEYYSIMRERAYFEDMTEFR